MKPGDILNKFMFFERLNRINVLSYILSLKFDKTVKNPTTG